MGKLQGAFWGERNREVGGGRVTCTAVNLPGALPQPPPPAVTNCTAIEGAGTAPVALLPSLLR